MAGYLENKKSNYSVNVASAYQTEVKGISSVINKYDYANKEANTVLLESPITLISEQESETTTTTTSTTTTTTTEA